MLSNVKPENKFHRVQFLSACLAKLLERVPNSALEGIEDSQTAEWVYQVEKIERELSIELQKAQPLTVATNLLAELMTREEEAAQFIAKHIDVEPSDQPSWFRIFDHAKQQVDELHTAVDVIKCQKEVIDQSAELVAAHEATIADLKSQLNRQPKRFRV